MHAHHSTARTMQTPHVMSSPFPASPAGVADATSPDKATVSQPWMVRVSGMWFTGDRKVAEPREQDKEEEDVIKWERQQLRSQRLSTEYFSLEVSWWGTGNAWPGAGV